MKAPSCFTWGQVKPVHVPLDNGGSVTLAYGVSACGRTETGDDRWDEAPDKAGSGACPKRVCPHCWNVAKVGLFRDLLHEAQEHRRGGNTSCPSCKRPTGQACKRGCEWRKIDE